MKTYTGLYCNFTPIQINYRRWDVQLQKYGYVSTVNWDKLRNDTSTHIQHGPATLT